MPADLDLKPYRDYHDYDLLQRMERHLARDRTLAAARKAELKSYAAAFREELRVRQAQAGPDGGPMPSASARKKAVAGKKAAKRTA